MIQIIIRVHMREANLPAPYHLRSLLRFHCRLCDWWLIATSLALRCIDSRLLHPELDRNPAKRNVSVSDVAHMKHFKYFDSLCSVPFRLVIL